MLPDPARVAAHAGSWAVARAIDLARAQGEDHAVLEARLVALEAALDAAEALGPGAAGAG